VTDPFTYYQQEIARTWGPACLHVESSKTIVGGKVRRVRNKITNGEPWQLERVLERCEDSTEPNTSYIERLKLFIRRSLAYLHRRTSSLAWSRQKLREAVTLLQCYYNFIRPHSTLPHTCPKDMHTPAQQAGLVTRQLRFRDIFMSIGALSRRAWLKNPEVRRAWNRDWQCVPSNS
jgi:hypothetical protein